MRTTLDIPDEVLAKAKQKAVEKNATLTSVVEEALRLYMSPARTPRRKVMRRWIVIKGHHLPPIDIADRDRLYEAMEKTSRDRG